MSDADSSQKSGPDVPAEKQTPTHTEIPGFSVSWTSPEGEEAEGPLDVLWQLIESYKVDIFDVSLNKITDDFLAFMRGSQELRIEHASSFTVMSSRLLYYKSKSLLPDPGFEDGDPEPRLPPELIQQLLEYRKFQMAAEKLRDIEEIASGMLSRETGLTVDPGANEEGWLDVSLVDVVRAYANIVQKISAVDDRMDMEITLEEFSVEDKLAHIKLLLEDAVSFSFNDLFAGGSGRNRGEIIATFLAILELTKNGAIVLRQKTAFGPIEIFKKSMVVR